MKSIYTNPQNEELWDFEVLDGVDFLNCNRIHPLKQKELQVLTESCARDRQIKELIVFGSAKEFRCNSRSDIDLVLVREDNKYLAPKEFAQTKSDIDLLFTVGEKLKEILWKDGVTVYKREET